ncbi:MgtC/SapB family protein [Rhizobium mayense]|uniref:MgtC/SapB family protein n=1 Tax=Rhizobium mayense TaxID=1312184 RepID=A0ABT7JRE4_9HYPH|nr:MgtC/SapB family protein [Rhizobium mayense]MDL2398315.1 MgtC/SapB family protein [Rhizobium mayense]
MDIIEAFQRLSLALAIGILVGVERGWQERETAPGKRTAGIRTFGLSGFLGGLAGFLQVKLGPVLPTAVFVVFGIAFIVFSRYEAEREQDYSVTSVIAALAVFVLGFVATVSDMTVAAAGGVAVTALLAARHSLHGFLRNLTWLELRAALVLLAMTLVALPLLPDRTIDPWNAINPFQLWLLTIMIAAISYVGYLAVRIAGPKQGILFSGAAGGFISSTAVTLSFARLSSESDQATHSLVAGASIAGAMSIGRALVISGILAPSLVPKLAPAFVPVILVFLSATFVMLRGAKADDKATDINPDNPFELRTVLRFGAFLGVISFISKFAIDQIGLSMIFVVALLSGLADLDAITLSTARMASSVLTTEVATIAISLAAAANLTMKMMLAILFGSRAYAAALSVTTLTALVVAAAAYFGYSALA